MPSLTAPDLAGFFADHGIDAVAIAPISRIQAPAGRHPADLLPSCRSIVVFGLPLPDRFFSRDDRERDVATTEITTMLGSAATGLSALLAGSGYRSLPVHPSHPLMVKNGRICGLLSLKHCARDAGLGTIGENSLLIHPAYGNRLALAAVITEMDLPPRPAPAALLQCTRCGSCSEACPTGAIRRGSVEIFSCRNLADYLPGPALPLFRWSLKGELRSRVTGFLLSRLSRLITRPACLGCMTACPYFHMD